MTSRNFLTVFVLGTTALLAAPGRGQQYQVLHQFHPNPANPSGLVQGSDGNFYGTTGQLGPAGAGTVFKMDASGAVTTLHAFDGSDGVRPQAALVQGSDGNFYGTTTFGGASGRGTVFKITPAGALTTLHSFGGPDGSSPQFGRWIQASDGSLYGTTIQGGANNVGTIFKITPEGALTTLHSFAGSEGSYPSAGLIRGSDGDFYGTAALGGVRGFGTVFRMNAAGAVTALYSFTGGDGAYPQAELIEGNDGSFYGTTPFGGTLNAVLNRGTVFKITPAGAFTSLHSFTGNDGANPQSGLIKASDGNLYGTTYGTTNLESSRSSVGTVFKLDSSGNMTTVHSFAGTDGARLSAGVIQAIDGNFYGATNQGGAEDDGTLFRMTSSGGVTTLYSFTGGDGFIPGGGLTEGSDGAFYGTTNVGGVSGANGTVFKMDSSGALTTLHSFTGSDGVYPNYCRLVDGNDGYFYGTTSAGGLGGSGFGTVFKMTPAGVVTTLHSFAKIDGASPSAGLTQGSDGNFYGLTFDGGPMSAGTVFQITPSGTFTSLHSFLGSDGQAPFGTVIQGSDGNFYGTTIQGGAAGAGTVFKMDAAGAVTTLHSFIGEDGAQPYGGLVQGGDGNFYGMTTVGGEGHDASSGYGTVFMITSVGVLTTIHSFVGSDGALPFGELTRGSDGNFYGTTSQGGASFDAATFQSGFGSVFKITPAGVVTTLHSFAGSAANDGSLPYGGPIEASDGSFYGTTEGGGPSFGGVAYRIVPATVPGAPTIGLATPGDGRATIAFTPPVSDGGSPILSYSVTCAPSGTATGPSSPISVTGLTNGTEYSCAVTATNGVGTGAPSATVSVTPVAKTALDFFTVAPCRVLDTRAGDQGGALSPGVARTLTIAGSCGIPLTAKAVSFNLTAASSVAAGSVVFYPDTGAPPVPATIHFAANQTRANNQVLGLATSADGTLQVQASIPAGGSLQVIVDVNGWFE